MHGKTSLVHHDGDAAFSPACPSPLQATRYHSLLVAPEMCLPERSGGDRDDRGGRDHGARHAQHPVMGVQFHPESVLTEHGYRMLD